MENVEIAPLVEGRIKISSAKEVFQYEKEKELFSYVQRMLCPESRFPSEKIAQIQEHFNMFDVNGDGKISIWELAEVFSKQGAKVSKDDLERIMREFDTDESKGIDFEEFIAIMADNLEVTDAELLEAFNSFDHDKSGTLSEEEIITVMRALGMWMSKSETKKMMIQADTDNSGDISYEEFVKCIKNS